MVRANPFLSFLNISLTMVLAGLLAHFYVTGTVTELGLTGYPYVLAHAGGHSLVMAGRQVVEHYNFGGVTDEENLHRDERLEVLYLGEEQVTDVVTFLEEGLISDSWELLIDRIEDESR